MSGKLRQLKNLIDTASGAGLGTKFYHGMRAVIKMVEILDEQESRIKNLEEIADGKKSR